MSPLPSQAAENLFWAGRYAERAEQTARLLRSILAKLREVEEFHDNDDRMSLHHLLRALTHVTLTYPGFTGDDARQKLADPRAELSSLISASDRPGSLRSSLPQPGTLRFGGPRPVAGGTPGGSSTTCRPTGTRGSANNSSAAAACMKASTT